MTRRPTNLVVASRIRLRTCTQRVVHLAVQGRTNSRPLPFKIAAALASAALASASASAGVDEPSAPSLALDAPLGALLALPVPRLQVILNLSLASEQRGKRDMQREQRTLVRHAIVVLSSESPLSLGRKLHSRISFVCRSISLWSR